MKTFAVIVLLVAVCVSSSSALRCYNCLFPGEPKCQEAVGLEGSECAEPGATEKALGVKPVCLKSVMDVAGAKQITRSCTKQGGTINACTVFKDSVEHCSVCETDLCNGSGHMLIKAWTLMMPIAIAMFMKFF